MFTKNAHAWPGLSGSTWCVCLTLSACAVPPAASPPSTSPQSAGSVQMPLLRGWFEGQVVFYITTDVSDAAVAQAKGANYAPRMGLALAARSTSTQATSVDKVYAVTNFEQASVFASAPNPMGHLSRDAAYSPLWRMVKVTWKPGTYPRTLKSEEEVLDAVEKELVTTTATEVVLNCPIVHRGALGGLVGVTIPPL